MFFGGKPFALLQCVLGKEFDAVVSEDIVAEYNEVMERIGRKYPNRPKRFPLDSFLSFCECIVPSRKIEACRDCDDNKFLECAVCAKCLYVVSGDEDLLSIKQFENVEIVTVAEFLGRYGYGSSPAKTQEAE